MRSTGRAAEAWPLDHLTFLIFSGPILTSLKRGPKAKREVYNASRFCFLGLGIVLCVRIAVPFRANGVVFLADDFARLVEELPGPFAHFFFSTVRWYEPVLTEC